MILLKNGIVFSPEPLGTRDVLVSRGKIIAVGENISPPDWDFLEVIDLEGRWVVPGFIDSHAHIAGAGGEGGPVTRTAGLTFGEIIQGGITSLVGCLGTDGITRNVESVLMKAKGLRQLGISAWIYTGSYQVPPPTILGSVSKDIAMIDEVIGAGEIAIADCRSSFPTVTEFVKIAMEAKTGGLLGGKAGIVNVHLGDVGAPFEMIYRAAKEGHVPYYRFLPTHCNRSREVFEEAKVYGKKGFVDLTTSSYEFYPEIEVKPSEAVFQLLDAGVPPDHITMSTDAGGSLPHFDGNGDFMKMEHGTPFSLFREVMDAIATDESKADLVLKTVTSNVADILKLRAKGHVEKAYDADLLVLNKKKDNIRLLIAGGRILVNNSD